MTLATEAAVDTVKAAPAATVAGMTIVGVQLSDVVLLATLVYTVLQVVLLLPKLKTVWKDWRNGRN